MAITVIVFAAVHYGYRLGGVIAIAMKGVVSALLFLWGGSLIPMFLFHFIGHLGSLYWARRAGWPTRKRFRRVAQVFALEFSGGGWPTLKRLRSRWFSRHVRYLHRSIYRPRITYSGCRTLRFSEGCVLARDSPLGSVHAVNPSPPSELRDRLPISPVL